LPLLAVVFAAALGGGIIGAFVGARLDGSEGPAATPTGTTVATVPPASTDDARVRAAIDGVIPAVVTVLADLPSQPLEGGGILESQNIGSGIVLHEDGTVITNYHVIDGASEITVVLSTGERRPAQLIADDSPFRDLAVLAIEPGGLRAAAVGSADDLLLGERVIVVSGGLVDFRNQVKVGVVSSTNVALPRTGLILDGLIQTDAAVNHGDSGGAMVDLDGRVVGLMTTVVRSQPSGQIIEGAGFAQPLDAMLPTIEAVRTTGVNPRGRLGIERPGVQHVLLDPDVASEMGAPVDQGAAIISIVPGSPADEAGLQVGDIVLGLAGQEVRQDLPLVNLLGAVPPGAQIELNVLRDGSELSIIVAPRPSAITREPAG
jgi:S1-C subfamily serine protease